MEPEIAITVDEIKANIGDFLGWGLGPVYGSNSWPANKLFRLDSCTKSGITRVHWPEIDGVTYEWTWIKPTITMTLPSGERTLQLPADYNGLEDKVIVSTTGVHWASLRTINEGLIDAIYASNPDATGIPFQVAERLIRQDGTKNRGTRRELYFYPEADQDYTVKFRYSICPNLPDDQMPYPLGGPAMREVYLESCLAVAEERFDNEKTVHADTFMRLLAGAISADRKHRQAFYGYNGDKSHLLPERGGRDWGYIVTHNGITPS